MRISWWSILCATICLASVAVAQPPPVKPPPANPPPVNPPPAPPSPGLQPWDAASEMAQAKEVLVCDVINVRPAPGGPPEDAVAVLKVLSAIKTISRPRIGSNVEVRHRPGGPGADAIHLVAGQSVAVFLSKQGPGFQFAGRGRGVVRLSRKAPDDLRLLDSLIRETGAMPNLAPPLRGELIKRYEKIRDHVKRGGPKPSKPARPWRRPL